MLKADEGWEKAVQLYEDRTGWQRERGDTLEEGIISTKSTPAGKVYRLEVCVHTLSG